MSTRVFGSGARLRGPAWLYNGKSRHARCWRVGRGETRGSGLEGRKQSAGVVFLDETRKLTRRVRLVCLVSEIGQHFDRSNSLATRQFLTLYVLYDVQCERLVTVHDANDSGNVLPARTFGRHVATVPSHKNVVRRPLIAELDNPRPLLQLAHINRTDRAHKHRLQHAVFADGLGQFIYRRFIVCRFSEARLRTRLRPPSARVGTLSR